MEVSLHEHDLLNTWRTLFTLDVTKIVRRYFELGYYSLKRTLCKCVKWYPSWVKWIFYRRRWFSFRMRKEAYCRISIRFCTLSSHSEIKRITINDILDPRTAVLNPPSAQTLWKLYRGLCRITSCLCIWGLTKVTTWIDAKLQQIRYFKIGWNSEFKKNKSNNNKIHRIFIFCGPHVRKFCPSPNVRTYSIVPKAICWISFAVFLLGKHIK